MRPIYLNAAPVRIDLILLVIPSLIILITLSLFSIFEELCGKKNE